MKKILVLSVLVLLVTSCKKKYFNYKITNDNVRQAMNVDLRSYFVYKNPANLLFGRTDSFSVNYFLSTGFYDYRGTGVSGSYSSYELLQYGMVNSLGDSIGFAAGGYSAPDSGYVEALFSMVTDSISVKTYCLFFPFRENETSPVVTTDYSATYAIKHHERFAINTDTLLNVYEMLTRQLPPGQVDSQYLRTFYTVENGLVRYDIRKGNGVWNVKDLRRSNIVRP